MPRTREALEALPGVGRKTANVVLNIAFGEPTIAVDTHVFRVANRTGLATGQDAARGRAAAAGARARAFLANAHHWLILHGRYVCQARRPLCERCAVVALVRLGAAGAEARRLTRERPTGALTTAAAQRVAALGAHLVEHGAHRRARPRRCAGPGG